MRYCILLGLHEETCAIARRLQGAMVQAVYAANRLLRIRSRVRFVWISHGDADCAYPILSLEARDRGIQPYLPQKF